VGGYMGVDEWVGGWLDRRFGGWKGWVVGEQGGG